MPLVDAAQILGSRTWKVVSLSAALCCKCCYWVSSNTKFGVSRSDMVFFAASIIWCVMFALMVHPLLVIPAIVMVWGAMAQKAVGPASQSARHDLTRV